MLELLENEQLPFLSTFYKHRQLKHGFNQKEKKDNCQIASNMYTL